MTISVLGCDGEKRLLKMGKIVLDCHVLILKISITQFKYESEKLIE